MSIQQLMTYEKNSTRKKSICDKEARISVKPAAMLSKKAANPAEVESKSHPSARGASLPDVAVQRNKSMSTALDWVGMSEIRIPLQIQARGASQIIFSRVQSMVSLDRSASRGIHMSRLYLEVQEMSKKDLTIEALFHCLEKTLQSHTQLSSSGRLQISMDLPLMRSSLKSGLTSWKVYPVEIVASIIHGKRELGLSFHSEYSSTCPASAALARELNAEHVLQNMQNEGDSSKSSSELNLWLKSEDGVIATPHAQRSIAAIQLSLKDSFQFAEIITLIDRVEKVLATPTQGAVKREDEQEFARLNGTNLMFCEDAARKVHQDLDLLMDSQPVEALPLIGYRLKFVHLESLHSHNAVAIKTRTFSTEFI